MPLTRSVLRSSKVTKRCLFRTPLSLHSGANVALLMGGARLQRRHPFCCSLHRLLCAVAFIFAAKPWHEAATQSDRFGVAKGRIAGAHRGRAMVPQLRKKSALLQANKTPSMKRVTWRSSLNMFAPGPSTPLRCCVRHSNCKRGALAGYGRQVDSGVLPALLQMCRCASPPECAAH